MKTANKTKTISLQNVRNELNLDSAQMTSLFEMKLLRLIKLNGQYYTSIPSFNKLKKRLDDNHGSVSELVIQEQGIVEHKRLHAIKCQRIDNENPQQPNYLGAILDIALA